MLLGDVSYGYGGYSFTVHGAPEPELEWLPSTYAMAGIFAAAVLGLCLAFLHEHYTNAND